MLTSNELRGYAMFFVATVMFAINGTIAKSILASGVEASRLSQLRVTSAFALLLIVIAVWMRPAFRLHGFELRALVAFGVLGIAVNQWLSFTAISLLPVGVALLIIATAPIMVAIWFRFAMHVPHAPLVWLGLALAMLGLALVGQVWRGFALDGRGVGAALLASVLFAVYYVLGDRQLRRSNARDPMSLAMMGFGAAAVFWALVLPWWTFPWHGLSGLGYPLGASRVAVPLWALCLFMIILGTALPFCLMLSALQRIRASQASVVGVTEPLLGAFIAWLALGEVLNAVQIAGAALVAFGVVLAEWSR